MHLSREGILQKYLQLDCDHVHEDYPFDLTYGGWIAHNKMSWWMRCNEGHQELIYHTILPRTEWGHKDLFGLGWVALALNVNDFEDRLEVVICGLFEKVGLDARDTLNQILGIYESLYEGKIVYSFGGEVFFSPEQVMSSLPLPTEFQLEEDIDKILEAELSRNLPKEQEARERAQYESLKKKFG